MTMAPADRPLVFLVGPPRSGTTVLASLLDGHPDLVVFPVEWLFFTRWWQRETGGAARWRMGLLTPGIDTALYMFKSGTHMTPYSAVNIEQELDYGRLLAGLREHDNDEVTAEECLRILMGSYHASLRNVPQGSVAYVMKTMLFGIDWSDADFCRRHKFIFTFRGTERRYSSVRFKFVDRTQTLGDAVQLTMRHLAYMKHARDVFLAFRHQPNFLTVKLNALKQDPGTEMRRVAEFLDVPFDDGLARPTFLGRRYAGNFRDANLNTGQINPRDSSYDEITSMEKYLVGLVAVGGLEPAAQGRPSPVKACSAWLRSALFELPRATYSTSTGVRGLPRAARDWAAMSLSLARGYTLLHRLHQRDLSRLSYADLNSLMAPLIGKNPI